MKIVPLARILWAGSPSQVVLIVVTAAASGLLSAGVIAFVGSAVREGGRQDAAMIVAFGALVLGKILTNAFSRYQLVKLSEDTILSMSLKVSAKVLATPLRSLEMRGIGRINTHLTDDVGAVTWAVQCLPMLVTNFAVLAGCVAYLAWLSWQACMIVVMATTLGALSYKTIEDRSIPVYRASRDSRSELFTLFASLTAGIKELLMNGRRRDAFLHEDLRAAADRYRASNLAATRRHIVGDAWTQALFYGLIGMALFAFRGLVEMPAATMVSYIFGLLYMMTPTWSILGSLPAIHRGSIALEGIESLAELADVGLKPQVPAGNGFAHSLELRGVGFAYKAQDSGERAFIVGPLDFRLEAGETVFVVGGNGSGKSTFAKLLVGLYKPECGQIVLDGQRVTDSRAEEYRELFSVVFTDFYLFRRLVTGTGVNADPAARRYLEVLRLQEKVSVGDGWLSTTGLSQGQRKRLALLAAYLEDRRIYVFDEWAADQDPEYKKVFYTELLPELKRRGKSVVVITHDDGYFHLGDRVVKLDEGRIVPTGAASFGNAAESMG